jgi:hypothetical protein
VPAQDLIGIGDFYASSYPGLKLYQPSCVCSPRLAYTKNRTTGWVRIEEF